MTGSIQDIKEKLKGFIADDVYFYTVLIVLVSVLSFGLGRWSMQGSVVSTVRPQVVLTEQPVVVRTATENQSQPTQQNFVASKKGTKYHLLTCPGASQMSEKNKVYFATEEEAQAAGYTKAKNCTF